MPARKCCATSAPGKLDACLVELLACKGGCINGPAMADVAGRHLSGAAADYRVPCRIDQPDLRYPARDWPPLERTYSDRKEHVPEFSEEQIQEVLHRVNKYTPDDELNCGACGYPTCREKAVATLRGMAEATMCIPYMRRRAESLRQVVMDVTPNAILIVDNDLIIQDMSPSAEKLFNCKLVGCTADNICHALMPVLDDFI